MVALVHSAFSVCGCRGLFGALGVLGLWVYPFRAFAPCLEVFFAVFSVCVFFCLNASSRAWQQAVQLLLGYGVAIVLQGAISTVHLFVNGDLENHGTAVYGTIVSLLPCAIFSSVSLGAFFLSRSKPCHLHFNLEGIK